MCTVDCLLLCIQRAGTKAPARTRTFLIDEKSLQPLLSYAFPVLVSGLPQLMSPIQTPGRRRRRRRRTGGWALWRRQTDRKAVWLRVVKTEEVIETENQSTEQDPRHKGPGWYTQLHPTHKHTDICSLIVQEEGALTDKTCAGRDIYSGSWIGSLTWSDGKSTAGCRQPGPEQEVCWG